MNIHTIVIFIIKKRIEDINFYKFLLNYFSDANATLKYIYIFFIIIFKIILKSKS